MALAILLISSALALPQCGGGPVLRRVDEGVSDRDPLSVSMRSQQVDLRQPLGFSGVYQVEGTDLFVRRSGALWAVFPRGLYTSKDGKAIVLPPAGMVYSIGTPSALREEVAPTNTLRAGELDLAAVEGNGARTEGTVRLDRRIDHAMARQAAHTDQFGEPGQADGRVAPSKGESARSRVVGEGSVHRAAHADLADERPPRLPPRSPPRFMDDEDYRRGRLGRLLAEAGGVSATARPLEIGSNASPPRPAVASQPPVKPQP